MKKVWGKVLGLVMAAAVGTAGTAQAQSAAVAAAVRETSQSRAAQLSDLRSKVAASLVSLEILKLQLHDYEAHQESGRMIRRVVIVGVCVSVVGVMSLRSQLSVGPNLTEAGGLLGFVSYVNSVPEFIGTSIGSATGAGFVVLRGSQMSELENKIDSAEKELLVLRANLQKLGS